MANFLVEMLVCQALFLGFYQFIKSEVYYKVNRLYLMISLILSLILPLFSFSDVLPGPVSQTYVQWLQPLQIGTAATETSPSFSEMQIQASKGMHWNIYHKIYAVGFMLYLVFFLFRNHGLFKYLNLNSFEDYKFTAVVIIPKTSLAFSFLDRIYIGGDIPESQRQVILEHEYQHIRKKHALELCFTEMLQWVLWFNPLIYIYKFQLRQLHEFEVDQSVSAQFSLTNYVNTLLNQSFGSRNVSFVHAFSRSSEIKTRIHMLLNTKKSKFRKLKYVLIVPVLALATLWSCSQDETLKTEMTEEEINEEMQVFFNTLFKDEPNLHERVKDKPNLKTLLGYYDLDIKDDYSEVEENKIGAILTMTTTFIENDKVYSAKINSEIKRSKGLKNALENFESELENRRSIRSEMQVEELNSDTDLITFALIDNPPHPNDCDGLIGEELKKCTSEFINAHINQNFDTDRFSDLEPRRYRVSVQFTIDKTGKVSYVRARGANRELEDEASKVILNLPQLIPGKVDGQPVNVLYGLPINFIIAE